MSLFLGIDTSNYTTSVAVYNSENGKMLQRKQLLPVKQGQLGLRQSDAVFHHTQQLHTLVENIAKEIDLSGVSALGVSTRPVRLTAHICRALRLEKTQQELYRQ